MDVLLGNLEEAQRRNPRFDHRTTIVHFGFADAGQIARAARLGAIVSANPYYVTALAGRYAELGIGPERSARMVPLGDAKRNGMSMSFHSDMPMAPAKPLHLVWSAMNRITAEGEVMGPDQRVDLDTSLRAITIDAAYSIRLENEVGSITPGKFANFTVLDKSPYDVDPKDIRSIAVWGTVLEGNVQQAPPLPQRKAAMEPARDTAEVQSASRPRGLLDKGLRLEIARLANDVDACTGRDQVRQVLSQSLAQTLSKG
jgi:predicted amidohydrolase YtcJ